MAKSKSSIRIFSKNLNCTDCKAQVYTFYSREHVVDISKPVKCKVCGKAIDSKALEGATDVLTPAEVDQFLPGSKSEKAPSGKND